MVFVDVTNMFTMIKKKTFAVHLLLMNAAMNYL